MGLRGPTPKPTAIVMLEGNRGKRPLNKREPKPANTAPHCASYLDKEARREWRRLMPILQRMRVLTEADYIALGNLCQCYSTMVKAQEQLSKTGLLFKHKTSSYIQQSPLLSIVNQCVDTITRLCREFGLTPSSRTRIQTAENEKASDQPDISVLNGQWKAS